MLQQQTVNLLVILRQTNSVLSDQESQNLGYGFFCTKGHAISINGLREYSMFTLWLTLFLHYPLGFDPDSSEKPPPPQPSTEEPSFDSEQPSLEEPLSIETAPPTNSSPTLETQEEEEEQPPTTEELLAQIDKSVFDLPMVYNNEVQFWVEHFSSNGRWTLSKWIRASGKYKNLIRKELRNAGLPEDLLYLAMIESGFDPQAESSASAVGPHKTAER